MTYELTTQYSYPNINVYRRYADGTFDGWKFETTDGYVMYNPNEENYELNVDTEEEIPVIYYYTQYHASLRYHADTFPYIAVHRDTVDEKYIF